MELLEKEAQRESSQVCIMCITEHFCTIAHRTVPCSSEEQCMLSLATTQSRVIIPTFTQYGIGPEKFGVETDDFCCVISYITNQIRIFHVT